LIRLLNRVTLRDDDSLNALIAVDSLKRSVPLRIAIIDAVQQMADKNAQAASWIRSHLKDQSESVRAEAAWALGYFGPGSSDRDALESAFNQEKNLHAKGKMASALGHFWERQKNSEQNEAAFTKMAKLYAESQGGFRAYLGRVLTLWDVPAALKLAHGITSK